MHVMRLDCKRCPKFLRATFLWDPDRGLAVSNLRKMARRAGWAFNLRHQIALCPDCLEGASPEEISVKELLSIAGRAVKDAPWNQA